MQKKKVDTSLNEDYYNDNEDDDREEEEDEDDARHFKANKMKIPANCNPNYQFCERLRFGRFSFQGMNLEIESLNNRSNVDRQSLD